MKFNGETKCKLIQKFLLSENQIRLWHLRVLNKDIDCMLDVKVSLILSLIVPKFNSHKITSNVSPMICIAELYDFYESLDFNYLINLSDLNK